MPGDKGVPVTDRRRQYRPANGDHPITLAGQLGVQPSKRLWLTVSQKKRMALPFLSVAVTHRFKGNDINPNHPSVPAIGMRI